MALKILHLEDDEADATLVREALRRDGLDCEIRHVSSRETLLKALAQGERVDVILSDFKMPGYSGVAAMSEAQAVLPDTPFVFVSGTAGEELVVESLKAGATDFVLKSQVSRLGPAVRRALKESEERIARTQAEATLADSLRFIQSIIDATPSLVYVYDHGLGRNLFVNREALRTLGYTEEQLRAMGPDFLERLIHPEDAAATRRTHGELAMGEREGEVVESEFRLKSSSGTWRWFRAREVAFESGGMQGTRQVLGTAQDITLARLTERRRAAQYAVTRVLAESSTWADAVPRVLESLREQLGAQVAEFWFFDEAAAVLRFGRAVLGDQETTDAWHEASKTLTCGFGAGLPGLVWETGAPYWGTIAMREGEAVRERLLRESGAHTAAAVPIRIGNTPTAVVVLYGMPHGEDDIDLLALLEAVGHQLGEFRERKRVEERVRDQAALLEHAREAIVVTGVDHRVTSWNKGAERLYGYSPEEALGRDSGDLFDCRNEAELREARQRVMDVGEWSGLIEQRSRDGRTTRVQSHWTLVRDGFGASRSILIISMDVTEAKRLEADLLRAQRLDSLGVLAGGIAHDLNNVLAPILMALDSLRKKVSDERSQRMFQLLEASATRGADLVRQVLAFARGVEGQRVLLEPQTIVRDLEKMLRDALPTSVQLALDVPAELWAVRGDPTQLHQVLLNLSVNARDAMSSGGVLGVSVGNVEVDTAFARMHREARPGPYIFFRVTDTGCGIAPDILDRIFEPFFTTKEAGGGTGLGLSTVMTIVKGHQGFMSVMSDPGRGSTFSVYLPATRSAERNAAEEASPMSEQGHGESVLVVDDEGAIREITKETLEASGYEVLTAADGAEAVGMCASHPEVDLVLMDIHMPVMDGAAAIRALLRIDPERKIIAVSGYSARESQAKSAGAKWFLVKPYTADRLLATIRQALDT